MNNIKQLKIMGKYISFHDKVFLTKKSKTQLKKEIENILSSKRDIVHKQIIIESLAKYTFPKLDFSSQVSDILKTSRRKYFREVCLFYLAHFNYPRAVKYIKEIISKDSNHRRYNLLLAHLGYKQNLNRIMKESKSLNLSSVLHLLIIIYSSFPYIDGKIVKSILNNIDKNFNKLHYSKTENSLTINDFRILKGKKPISELDYYKKSLLSYINKLKKRFNK